MSEEAASQSPDSHLREPQPNHETPVRLAGNLRPEIELLLCCARVHLDSERAERMRELLQRNIDWEYLLRMATRHGMMPLLYWHLKAHCADAVPQEILDQLRDYSIANTRTTFS